MCDICLYHVFPAIPHLHAEHLNSLLAVKSHNFFNTPDFITKNCPLDPMITATTVYFNQSTIIFFDSMTPESLLIMMFSVLLIVGSIASSSRIASFFSFFFYRFITFILKAFFSAFAMLIAKESNLSSHYSFGALLFGWWIVASILSWIPWIRALIFSRSFKLQKQINQESTVTKTLANLFSLGVGIAGFNDLSQDVPGEKHLIVVVSVIVVRIWLSFMFSSMVLFIEQEAFRACSWRRKLHKQLPGRFRNVSDHEEDGGYEIEYEHLHEFYDQIESSFYDESGHHLVEFSSSYESGHHPVESSSYESCHHPVESSLFYHQSDHHPVESSSYESGHHPVESSSQETGRS